MAAPCCQFVGGVIVLCSNSMLHSPIYFRVAWLFAAIRRASSRVSKPVSDSLQLSISYSITSSAVTSSVFGTVKPRAVAVFLLISSTNLTGCWTGRSPGLAPFRMTISVGRGTPEQVERIHPIGEQSAGRDESSVRINCWDAVSLSLPHDASYMRIHEIIRHDQNAAIRSLRHRSENRIDVSGVMYRAYDQLRAGVARGGFDRP